MWWRRRAFVRLRSAKKNRRFGASVLLTAVDTYTWYQVHSFRISAWEVFRSHNRLLKELVALAGEGS